MKMTIIELLREKEVFTIRLNNMTYSLVEIRGIIDKKDIYTYYKENSVNQFKYAGKCSKELNYKIFLCNFLL